MKKSIITTIFAAIFFLSSVTVFAQYEKPNRIFKKGQFDVTTSIGLAPTFLADGGKSVVPPLMIGADYMFTDNFSLGLSMGHSVTNTKQELFSDGLIGHWNNKTFEATLKTGFHVTKFDNMSIYGGFLLNYNVALITPSDPDMDVVAHHKGINDKESAIIPGGYIGFKYAVAPKVTLNSELGFSGLSIFKIGVGYRLKK